MLRSRFRSFFALFAVAAVLSFVITEADARAGRGFSGGSRGARTYSGPPPTNTAPTTAAPMQRTVTQPSSPVATAATTGQAPGLAGRANGLFGGGLLGGLAAGFVGAGLFGMLFGNGFLSGLGSFASVLGLLLQIGLVVVVARLAWLWWQRRSQPALAGGPSMFDNLMGGSRTPASGAGSGPAGLAANLESKDFDEFERLLGEIQSAYAAEDLIALRNSVTPEMYSYFAEELTDNASRGVVNRISGVKLLQGDLAEGWREGASEYATVAMRYSLVDQVLDRTTGRAMEGSASPIEVTELWTFRRAPGHSWLLSAIQQTS